jgi:ribosome maturation factor RimP
MTPADTTPTPTSEPFIVPLDPTEELVRSLVEPVIEDEGCELVHLQVVKGQRRSTLRLFVDTPGEENISLAALEKLNRSLGDLLDVEDEHRGIFRGRYDLEVSSPGLDRPLAKRSHFDAAIGKKVKVKTRTKVAGAKHHSGVLAHVEDEGIRVGDAHDDGALIEWRDIGDAHVVYEFEAPKKKRRGDKREKRSKRKQAHAKGEAASGGADPQLKNTTEKTTEEKKRAAAPAEE